MSLARVPVLPRPAATVPVPLVLLGLLAAGASSAVAQPRPDTLADPGPQHAAFEPLVGAWEVELRAHGGRGDGSTRLAGRGTAAVTTLMGGRFLRVVVSMGEGAPASELLYLIGYDRRNGRYQVLNLDDSATYWVASEGGGIDADGWVVTSGRDDDPLLAARGLEKAFVLALDLADDADGWGIQTRLVDTRVAERPEIPYFTLRFRRPGPERP